MRNTVKRTATAVAASGLLLTAAACGEDDVQDSVSDAGSAAEEGAGEAGDALDDLGSPDDDGTDGDDGAAGEDGGDGDSTELSENMQAAYDEAGGEQGEWGAVVDVESTDEATLATFDNGWLVENDAGEVTPLIGMIGQTWAEDGGLENEVGLPTAPESGDAVEGWTQTFENGTITWSQDEEGNWEADTADEQ